MSGVVAWITGLPQAGKSTLAARAAERLRARGVPVAVVDSDALRDAMVPTRGYRAGERDDFYATLGNLAAMLARQGIAVLVPATANRRAYRDRARAAAPAFVEVWVDADAEICAARDDKRLYARARAGEIRGLPGVDADYEAPEEPEVIATGGQDDAALDALVELLGAPAR